MAQVFGFGFTWTTTAGDKTIAGGPPAIGDLAIIICGASGTTGANADTSAVTDNNGSGTYTSVYDSGTGSSPRVRMYVRNSRFGSTASTTVTLTQTNSSGGGGQGFLIRGITRAGVDAIVQTTTTASGVVTAGTAPAPVFPANVDTRNPTVGGVINNDNPPALTPPTSWTEIQDVGYTTPPTGLESVYREGGFSGTTVTWGSNSVSAGQAVLVEVDRTTPGLIRPFEPIPLVQAIMHHSPI